MKNKPPIPHLPSLEDMLAMGVPKETALAWNAGIKALQYEKTELWDWVSEYRLSEARAKFDGKKNQIS